jgi:hypothetical protein
MPLCDRGRGTRKEFLHFKPRIIDRGMRRPRHDGFGNGELGRNEDNDSNNELFDETGSAFVQHPRNNSREIGLKQRTLGTEGQTSYTGGYEQE